MQGGRRERTAFVRELFGAGARVGAFEETAFVAELGGERVRKERRGRLRRIDVPPCLDSNYSSSTYSYPSCSS